MNINLEDAIKHNLHDVIEEETMKLIEQETQKFRDILLKQKDRYVEEVMKSIRIFSQQQTVDNIPRYKIEIENVYRLENN